MKIDIREWFMAILVVAVALLVIKLGSDYSKKPNDPSLPTAAEMHRLDNDLIMYCPSDAIRILQRSLVGEGYQIQVDGVMGQETYNAAMEWQGKKK